MLQKKNYKTGETSLKKEVKNANNYNNNQTLLTTKSNNWNLKTKDLP